MNVPTRAPGRAALVAWVLSAIVVLSAASARASEARADPGPENAEHAAATAVLAGVAPASGSDSRGLAPTAAPVAATSPLPGSRPKAPVLPVGSAPASALPPAGNIAPPAPQAAPLAPVPVPASPVDAATAAGPAAASLPGKTPAVIPSGDTPPGDSGERLATETLNLLGGVLLPGTQGRLAWAAGESFAGIAVPTPVLVSHGTRRGLTLCLTAAVHGDELNGVEIVRQVYYDLNPAQLSGTVIGVPIVNLPGFRRGSRYLPDRRDLNRYFPGSAQGSAAARIAHSFFTKVAGACDAVIDLHTGSLHRTNLPHVRADLNDSAAAALAQAFANVPVLNDRAAPGTLRRAATHSGMAAVTFEAGSPLELQREVVTQGVQAVRSALANLGMIRGARRAPPPRVFKGSSWVRSESGGILLATVQPGDRVHAGQRLGNVVDPITNANVPVQSPVDGVVLGQALDQVVLPGFAAFHIAIEDPVAVPPDTGVSPEPRLPESPEGPEVERPE